MRKALYFCFNSEYLDQFKVLAYTLNKFGKIPADVDWFVFSPDVDYVDYVDYAENATVIKTSCEYKTDFDGEPYQNSDDKLFGAQWLANKGYNQALYLDCDIVINGDISELFNAIECDIAAVKEYFYPDNYLLHPVYLDTMCINERYFNSGVMVINLKSDFLFKRLHDPNRSNDLIINRKWRDQEWLNFRFKNASIKELPKKFNWKPEGYAPLCDNDLSDHMNSLKDAVIVHFAGKAKPWKKAPITVFSYEFEQVPYELYREVTDSITANR